MIINMIRKTFISFLALVALLSSCGKDEAVSEIQLNLNQVTLSEGQSITLKAAATPSSALSQLQWRSLDESVASVNDGVVTALKSGETYVIASIGEINKGCLITVIASVDGLTLDKDALYMSVGDVEEIKATVSPAHALNPAVKWSTSDASVVSVVDGVVTALANGTAVITAVTEDGGYTQTCTVMVMTMPESMTIAPSELTINLGETQQMTVEFEGADDSTLRDVVWSSSDETVARVDASGILTALGGGEAVITAKSVANGLVATADVTVYVPLKGISFEASELQMYNGDRHQLTCIFNPADADNKNVSWSSSDSSVATVTDEGVVFAWKNGEVVITAVSQEGGYEASCHITVVSGTDPVTGVTLDKSELRLVTGRYADLIAVVSPVTAADKTLSWSSSDVEIATVDHLGRVTAGSKAGEAVITVTTTDGGFTAQCKVVVVNFDSGLPGYGDGNYEWND